jgi:riboflavin synthase
MFTGLVERTAQVAQMMTRTDGGARLLLAVDHLAAEVALGDSIAVNGCCLTVTEADTQQGTVAFDLLAQTLRVTNLGALRVGKPVNLERALRAGAHLGGHMVQGHVDTTVRLLTWQQEGADWRLEVELPAECQGLVLPKGSICLDGISLTAAEVTSDRVTCWIIPHTRQVTHLASKAVGQRMNVEWDMLGKYVRELVKTELSRLRQS